jgi:ankyrin repeat protein
VVIADEGNRTPLHLACENGSAIVVQLLLDQNAAVNTADKYGLTPLCVACDKGNLSCVQLLLNKDSTETIFSVDDLETALSYAQRHSHTHIATMIHARLLPARMSACSKTAPKQPSIRKKRLSKMFNKH